MPGDLPARLEKAAFANRGDMVDLIARLEREFANGHGPSREPAQPPAEPGDGEN